MKPSIALYKTLFILILLFQAHLLKAQNDDEITWRDRIYFGGNFSFTAGTITLIQVSPITGYRITPRWSAGLGFNYEYYKNSEQYYGYIHVNPYSTNIYGGSVFTNFVFLKNFPVEGISLLAQTEYEALSLEKKYFQDYYSSGRFVLNSFFAGGGIRQKTGRRSSINILLLWNFNETQYSPYSSNPVFKFNFIF